MRTRVITALLIIPIVLAACFFVSPWPLYALTGVVCVLASHELGKLTNGRSSFPILGLATVALLGGFLYGAFPDWTARDFMVRNSGLLAAGYLGIGLLAAKVDGRLIREAASLWIAAPLSAAVLLKCTERHAEGVLLDWRTPLLLLVVPLWAGDIAGLLVGRSLGRRKLAPTISPNKTLEGAIGNLAVTILAAWGVGTLLAYPAEVSVICGVIISVLGQIGDLLESAVKRSVQMKDSGALLPGHGGLLDRIDSMLLAAPAVVAWLAFGA